MYERLLKDINSGEVPPLAIKGFRLITPATAVELGVETEAPIFVSRSTGAKDHDCYYCGVHWSALTYDLGSRVASQHLHPSEHRGGGGIYYEFVDPESISRASIYGWIARVLPIGETYINERSDAKTIQGRSAQVEVVEFMALCSNGNCEKPLLTEGIAVFDPKWCGSLLSYHADCVPDKEGVTSIFEFKMVDGRPLFSQI